MGGFDLLVVLKFPAGGRILMAEGFLVERSSFREVESYSENKVQGHSSRLSLVERVKWITNNQWNSCPAELVNPECLCKSCMYYR